VVSSGYPHDQARSFYNRLDKELMPLMTKPSTKADAHTARLRRTSVRLIGLLQGAWRDLAVPTEKRSPFLDGLRAIAILLVINAHEAAAFSERLGKNFYTRFPVTSAGWMGVDLFFVLSGFFIGSQLWRELAQTGTISFSRFIIRRGLRIWPLYFFVFAVVAIMFPAVTVAQHYGWSDLTFLTNYFHHGIVDGSWSLCSEEQFYILAPLSMLLFKRRSAAAYRWGLGVLLVVELGVRMWTFHSLTGHLLVRNTDAMQHIYFPFHTHSDGLIAGLLIANLIAYAGKARTPKLPWIPIVTGVLFLLAAARLNMEVLNFTGLAVFFGGVVWLGTQYVIPIFNGHIFYLLSRLSFGMYLNHQYMEQWVAEQIAPRLLHLHLGGAGAAFGSCVVLVCLSAFVSALTFALLEHPFLVLRTAILGRKAIPRLVAH
jgi:peptidoglycan/LPS O-acetylase OafA/YrhL